MNKAQFLLLSVLVALFCTCGQLSMGGSSQQGNGIVVGCVVSASCRPVTTAHIRVRPADYVQAPGEAAHCSRAFDATTDLTGHFSVSGIFPGSYTVEACNGAFCATLVKTTVGEQNDTADVGTIVLKPCARIIGVVTPAATGPRPQLWVQVRGLERCVPVGADSTFAIVDLPEGSFDLRLVAADSAVAPAEVFGINASTGLTSSVVILAAWRYARRLYLNTTASGAGVAKSVTDFPVLIRLTAVNFDFSQAKNNGTDLRFIQSGAGFLSCEIERWDAPYKRAEIWVKVGTVYGNNRTQSLTMYWGNAASVDASNSTAVFDTAAGFQGVWHLSDSAAGQFHDATVNKYHGTSPDSARPQAAEGAVGPCRAFDGVADYITMPNTAGSRLNFPENSYFTVSAWVNLDSTDDSSHLIIAKGYEQYFLRLTRFPSNSPLWEFSEFNTSDSWQACTTKATVRQWTLVTGVRQGNKQSLYCNGVLVDNAPVTYLSTTLSRNTSNDLSVGRFLKAIALPNNNQGYCFFKGRIDEVQVLSKNVSAYWVRLCYMNQRADDRLVEFNR
jgi:hypothetical protein